MWSVAFPCSRAYLYTDSYKWHLGTPHPLAFSGRSTILLVQQSWAPALPGGSLGRCWRHRGVSIEDRSKARSLSLADREGTTREGAATIFFSGFMTRSESCISWIFLLVYAFIPCSLSFSSHRAVELCALNESVCLSECVPSVWWNSSQLNSLRSLFPVCIPVLC